jgi:hypothetical protein
MLDRLSGASDRIPDGLSSVFRGAHDGVTDVFRRVHDGINSATHCISNVIEETHCSLHVWDGTCLVEAFWQIAVTTTVRGITQAENVSGIRQARTVLVREHQSALHFGLGTCRFHARSSHEE